MGRLLKTQNIWFPSGGLPPEAEGPGGGGVRGVLHGRGRAMLTLALLCAIDEFECCAWLGGKVGVT